MRIAASGCVALADGSFWLYEYDKLGQVKSGKKYWSDWTPVAGQQFEYGFDDIGNRTGTKAGGDENGANLRPATYTANKLNQYSSRTVPGYVDVTGVALAGSTVTVNSTSPYRRTEYFRKELTAANTSVPVWQSVSVAATGETTVNGNVFVPQTPESYTYDLDGNVTADGRWTYTWDAENRLVKMVKNSPTIDLATAPTGASFQKLGFVYDALGRRIAKSYYTLSTDTTPFLTYRFLYDGWNLLAIVNAQSSLLASFTWGNDLSGSLQGAGGMGGLLLTRDTALGTVNFAGYDGNANVMVLVNAADGKVNAQYEYGPFGEPIRATGTMAKANPFRFSTKYQDNETDLLYYGYRFYNQSTGRWLSRDPLGEAGGANTQGFIRNDPVGRHDYLGLLFDDPLAGMGDLFLMFLLHGGDSWFNGYSDLVWSGIMNNENVARYFDSSEALAKAMGRCCSDKKKITPRQTLVHRESLFGFTSGGIEAGFAIGTGNVEAGKGLLRVKCDATVCTWSFESTITVSDRYSFHAFDGDMRQMPWYTLDNNLLLRWLELIGRDFDISDSRVQERSGSFPCVK